MPDHSRYAVYYLPDPGPLAEFGAAWLGWDVAAGLPRAHPDLPGLPRPVDQITATPRKYGLHATIKPPFRLAPGTTPDQLAAAARALCAAQAPVTLAGLQLTRLGGFLALTITGDTARLDALAAAMVRGLDTFRAPAPEAELARRRAKGLSPAQEAMLTQWGYPHVLEEFRFHVTLTGSLPRPEAEATAAALAPVLAPLLPAPLAIRDLCIAGERPDGRFELMERMPLLHAPSGG